MTGFDDRRQAFESKFAHDEEMKFKAVSRRNKIFGLAVADMLGKSGDDAQAYAKEVILADFEEAGDEDIFRKAQKDFSDAGLAYDDSAMRVLLIKAMDQAERELTGA